jgi:hypothetical protein
MNKPKIVFWMARVERVPQFHLSQILTKHDQVGSLDQVTVGGDQSAALIGQLQYITRPLGAIKRFGKTQFFHATAGMPAPPLLLGVLNPA